MFDAKRIHIDLDGESADASSLPGPEGARRHRIDNALHPGFLVGLELGRLPRFIPSLRRPFGKIQRPVRREVTNRKTGVEPPIE
jgi:hypothetical protein